jgi:hypothetical protein
LSVWLVGASEHVRLIDDQSLLALRQPSSVSSFFSGHSSSRQLLGFGDFATA